MNNSLNEAGREHDAVTELLAWYVNDTLNEADSHRVARHLQDCSRCRDDLALEQRLHAALGAERSVEYMPSASLKKLNARLDGLQSPELAPRQAAVSSRRAHWSHNRGALAASVALAIVAVSGGGGYWWHSIGRGDSPFVTVTTPRAVPAGEVIRAVFSPRIQLAELQSILDEAQLRIVAGPSEAGVYSLASTSAAVPVAASLALLRKHGSVRFAEATGPAPPGEGAR
jgi:anti-sigma factor RsiW